MSRKEGVMHVPNFIAICLGLGCALPRLVMMRAQEILHTEWPAGDYSLLQSLYGCPSEDEDHWIPGYMTFSREQGDTVDEWATNLKGPFTEKYVQLNFCTPRNNFSTTARWPVGSYCILSRDCPVGFLQHQITWTSGIDGSHIELDGGVSFLQLDPEVSLGLCCRDDSTQALLRLPAFHHSYLVQVLGKPCPEVKGSNVEEESPEFLKFWQLSTPGQNGNAPKQQIKLCFYTPIEVTKECYNPKDRGASYKGTQDITKINTTCDPWWDLYPNIGFHWVDDIDTPHQYCRSPFEEFMSPWCLTNVTEEIPGVSTIKFRVAWCDIPECDIDVPPNAASNRPVIQSSTMGVSFAYLTVDGHTESCSITTKQYRPWLQINLQEIYEVHAVFIERERVYNKTLVNFNIYVSMLDWDFQYGGASICARNQSSGLHYDLWYDCVKPLTGQYVTIESGIYQDPNYRPPETMTQLSMCEIQVYAKATGCGRPLGMTSGEMSSFQITASSHDPNLPPGDARLHGNSRWCAAENVQGQLFIQVDLIYETSIQGLVIQGTTDRLFQQQQYVTSFSVQYGPGPDRMVDYQDYPSRIKMFQLARQTNAPEIVKFYRPVVAQYLRLNINTFEGRPCMKFEILGCQGDDSDKVSLTSYPPEAYPFVDTTSGKPCVFPYVYQGVLQYGCIIDDIRNPWCATTDNYDRDQEKGNCIIRTEGGNAGGAPCVFPYHYLAPTYYTCISKSNIAQWCPTTADYDKDQKWGFCPDIAKPTMVSAKRTIWPAEEVTCLDIKAARTLQCGWDGISKRDCLNLDCCFDETSRFHCFMKGIPCNGVKIATEGFFYSPNYPFYYGQLRECSWDITAPPGQYIDLELKQMNLAIKEIRQERDDYTIDPGQCADTLTVYVIQDDGTLMLLRKLNDEPEAPTMISPTNRMRVEFSSCARYSVTEAMGFAAYVHFKDCAGCNVGLDRCSTQNLCASSCGEIASLNYPLPYAPNQRCNWKIEVGQEEYIVLTIHDFDIRSDNKLCESDSLYLYDFSNRGEEQLIGVFCNYNLPPSTIKSSWSNMRLELSTDFQNHGAGFSASYRSQEYSIGEDIKQAIYSIDPACKLGWVGYGGSCLQLFNQTGGITWLQAEDNCQQLGGHLLSVQNQKEMDLVHYVLTTRWMAADNHIYIGLNDIDVEGNFVWTDHRPMTFTDWALADTTHVTNEPNGGDNEDCTFMKLSKLYSTASWHDTACSYDKVEHYICEVGKEGANDTSSKDIPVLYNMINMEQNVSCPLEYYQCGTGECVMSAAYCDGHTDCMDGSDEIPCEPKCSEYNFQCTNGDCVSISSYCDHKVDCTDGSDETSCVYPTCNHTEFKCDNYQCIPQAKHCDLLRDCWDGSDERLCAGQCGSENGFQCYAGNCIPSHAKCDGWIDCAGFDHEDETDECLTQRRSCRDWRLSGNLEDGNYKIDPDGTGAFPVECLMNTGRGDVITVVHHSVEPRMYVQGYETPGSYEMPVSYVGATAKQLRILMASSDHCEQHLNIECKGAMLNGFNHYQAPNADGSALKQVLFEDAEAVARGECGCILDRVCHEENLTICSCGNNQNLWKRDSGLVTDEEKLPFMVLNLGDTGHPDEGIYHTLGPLTCYQAFNESFVSLKCKSGNAVESASECLYDRDPYHYLKGCRDATHLENCRDFRCPPNFLKCPSTYCVPRRFICNGVFDCPNGEDEHKCAVYRCPGQYLCRNQGYCIPLEQRCDGVWQCEEGDDELLCDLPCPPGCICIGDYYNCSGSQLIVFPYDIAPSARKIDLSGNGIIMRSSDLLVYQYLAELDLSSNGISDLFPNMFFMQSNLYFLNLGKNNIQTLLPGVFNGLWQLNTLILTGNKHLEVIQRGSFIGLNMLPSLDMSGSKIKYLEDNVFEGLNSVAFINISQNDINIISRYAFEHLTNLGNLDMEGNNIEDFQRLTFDSLTNIKYLRSDAFKFCCLVRDRVSEAHCHPPRDEISSCEDLMRIEVLRIFLWIFGLSALVGNGFVLLWRIVRKQVSSVNGYLILNLAASDLVMGAYMIIIASADMYYRGVYIEKADKWQHSWLCNFAGFLATFASEASVFALCIITVDRFIAIVLAFHVKRMTKKGAKIIMGVMWLVAATVAAIPLLPLDYFQGEFYARSGVCVSLHLTNEPRPGWEYSVAIFVGLNFITFLIITLGYLYMYCVVKQSSQAVGSVGSKTNTRDKELALARKMTLIVMTDFFCWAPIIFMSILALCGTKISGDVYAWIIVFVLPINSAINPYLYTISDLDLIQKIRNLCGNSEELGLSDSSGSTVATQISTTNPETTKNSKV